MKPNWERSLFKSSLILAMMLSNSTNGRSQRLEIGESLRTQPPRYSQPSSAAPSIAFPIPSLPNPQSFRLTLQPLNLLSNSVPLPEPDTLFVQNALQRSSRFETVPFAIDPILKQTMPLRSLEFSVRGRKAYSEMFLSRLLRSAFFREHFAER